ncbi:MAG: hypothetical protein M3P51_06000 [Chloroflexota bacterium]|nr:hypothetical protein [Chloroflexota bacterium]
MDIAYAHTPDFEIEVERKRQPLGGVPVVLGGSPHDRLPVRRVSQEAVREGVREGMPLREAAARCPSAVFLPYSEDLYREASARLISLLEEYSDSVEPDGYGCAYLEASGWGRLPDRVKLARDLVGAARIGTVASPLERHSLSVGLAPTKFTARLAARATSPGRTTPISGWMQDLFLSGFPVEQLPFGEKNLRKLRRLGVRTIGEFAALPAAETKLQFGAEGVLARQLATGEDRRPVTPPHLPRQLRAYHAFEPPLGDAEILRAVLGRLVGELRERLGEGTTSAVEVCLVQEDGQEQLSEARLPFPSASTSDLLLAATRALERLPVQSEVQRLQVRLPVVAPDVARQASLWKIGRHSEQLHALGRLREQFGPDRVRRVVLAAHSSLLSRARFALVEQP